MARTITCRSLTRLGPDDLVLCSGTIRAAPFAHTVSAASAAGFQGVSLYYDEYTIARAEGWTDADMRALLDDNGVAVAEIDGRMDWLPDDWGAPSVADFVDRGRGPRRTVDHRVGERAAGASAPTSRSTSSCERSAPLCDRAADHGVLVHLEYFPWSGIALVRERARDRRRRRPRQRRRDGRRLASRTRSRPGRARRRGGLRVGARGAGERRRHDPPRRRPRRGPASPGPARRGAGGTGALLRALRDQGCVAPMEVEVYSDELTRLAPAVAAQRAGDALRAVLDRSGTARAVDQLAAGAAIADAITASTSSSSG